ncbi:hypothetical protein RFI_38872 [Reticulomyxa filosa]|uniref:Uncharacterized protein n=1 Tax=Reticulomyxa filosa TaxID=46433 RepID=X6LB67_RETFI|nr:hypothetical protein RFI_38872 [Reticulomyxa filosa]|eukprot:ETN98620.1 hypothetical protein RFI_38872 [Reticulomyxa filosa]
MKQHSIGTKISKSQVYEAFNEQWIDVHVKNISKKIKLDFQNIVKIWDLKFATENNDIKFSDNKILDKLDPTGEKEIKSVNEKTDMKMNEKRITLI